MENGEGRREKHQQNLMQWREVEGRRWKGGRGAGQQRLCERGPAGWKGWREGRREGRGGITTDQGRDWRMRADSGQVRESRGERRETGCWWR